MRLNAITQTMSMIQPTPNSPSVKIHSTAVSIMTGSVLLRIILFTP